MVVVSMDSISIGKNRAHVLGMATSQRLVENCVMEENIEENLDLLMEKIGFDESLWSKVKKFRRTTLIA
jgi:hypothetical protein